MLAERLKSLRLEHKLTQKEIAEKLGVSKMTYSYWENGQRNPKNVQQLADFFNVSTDYLLGKTDIKNQKKLDDDLEKSLDTFRSFDGKPMTDSDRETIREVLKRRQKEREQKANK
ncbi:helix-turn-helix transcriptional regulator [Pseudolactococcus yaeyamensis]